MKKGLFKIAAVALFLTACAGDDVAGGASGDAGITAVKDWEVAGVSQKGPFVTGSAVTVQELDGITLKQTGKSFKGTIKSDKGDFAIKDINLQSQYAILEASGYYRDEISGKKSSGTVTLRALTDLSNRKTVNINLLTHLEYERVMYLVTEKKKSIAEAKEQAEKEILASFGIDGDFAESEDLNIFESGDGNAALLAVSVLMQSDVDVAGLTERMGEFSIALAEGGSWDDADTKTAIADWACDVDLKGTITNVRKNIENWKYADSVPSFEKYVTNFWWDNYGLGVCNDKRENETKRNVNKLSKLYNEYFVCEKGRWVIPVEEKSSSSKTTKSSSSSSKENKQSSSIQDVSSSSTPIKDLSSSSVASSGSVYNPFSKVPELPAELAYLDSIYQSVSYMKMGDGRQNVWFYTTRGYYAVSASQDSAAAELVKSLGKIGFSYEGAVLNDSLRSGPYNDTSYVYAKEKNGFVYKVAVTKKKRVADGFIAGYGFDIKVVVLMDGFKEMTSKTSDLPDELVFVEKYLAVKTEPTKYADGKQIVWRGETEGCGNCVSLIEELINEVEEVGFNYVETYSNDSLDNEYTEDSQVYSKSSGGKVYSLVFTKGEKLSATTMGIILTSGIYHIKLIVRDEEFDEIPTETKKDYSSPRYRDFPEDLKFIKDTTDYNYRTYSDDSLRTTWYCYGTIGRGGYTTPDWATDLLDAAKDKADEYATLMKSQGFTLISEKETTMKEIYSKGYRCYWDDSTPVTLYSFEKDVEGFHYKVDVYPCVETHTDNAVGTVSYPVSTLIETTIYNR